jgi:hypothetical protein
MQHCSSFLALSIYKAATIRPATTAARPNSTFPAAPLASGRPPEPVALPEGLGPPVAAGTVSLPLPCPLEPVGYMETREEPAVPVGLWDEPVAVFEPEVEAMAVAITCPVSICTYHNSCSSCSIVTSVWKECTYKHQHLHRCRYLQSPP